MNIVRQKDYYYLAHSFRKDGEVVHREKYLGRGIPADIEELKDAFLHECMQEGVIKKLKFIKKNFRKEWKRCPQSVKKEILIDLSVSFTYNTNAIEGSTITREETEDIIKNRISPNKPIRDVQETLNHSKVFFEVLNEKKELSKHLILQWHEEIFKDTKPDIAGKIRDYLVRVGSYVAPDWQELGKLMKEFFGWYSKNKGTMNPVELAARAHYKFEKIHPFGDGNGRAGRLVIAYILKRSGYPLLIIEHKKRKAYYHALSKPENDFVNFFFRGYISAHKKYAKMQKFGGKNQKVQIG
ncbi:Fic family protein [Candidatus Woesearchaeota archaeon]|nr:Fic family protein [Candidatus Woesearchaeota archaeon]